MKWINIKDEKPDHKKYKVLVYCTSSLYTDDPEPTIETLNWYKSSFGDFHEEFMKKITHWSELPKGPKTNNHEKNG